VPGHEDVAAGIGGTVLMEVTWGPTLEIPEGISFMEAARAVWKQDMSGGRDRLGD